MAVQLEGTIRRFIGRSDDQKPRPGVPYGLDQPTPSVTDILPGSSFLETDTGRIYRWSGTEWAFIESDDQAVLLLEQLLKEVQHLRLLVQLRANQ